MPAITLFTSSTCSGSMGIELWLLNAVAPAYLRPHFLVVVSEKCLKPQGLGLIFEYQQLHLLHPSLVPVPPPDLRILVQRLVGVASWSCLFPLCSSSGSSLLQIQWLHVDPPCALKFSLTFFCKCMTLGPTWPPRTTAAIGQGPLRAHDPTLDEYFQSFIISFSWFNTIKNSLIPTEFHSGIPRPFIYNPGCVSKLIFQPSSNVLCACLPASMILSKLVPLIRTNLVLPVLPPKLTYSCFKDLFIFACTGSSLLCASFL